jgi:Spy/CpxP family protein refolding chaperone
MKRLLLAAALVSLGVASPPTGAQESSRRPKDPISAQVLPPELILQHQKAIGLTNGQLSAILAEVKRVQGRLLELQWQLKPAVDRMVELMSSVKVDETAAAAQLEQILTIEREMKQLQLEVAVRIKNQLLPEQQRLLKELGEPRTAPPGR